MTLKNWFQRYPTYIPLVPVTPKFKSASPYGQAFLNCRSLRQMHRMIKGQRYPIYVLQVSPNPKFHSVLLCRKLLSSYRTFWHRCVNDPKLAWITKASKVPRSATRDSQLSSISLYGYPFFEKQAIWRKVHPMTPKWPWTLRGKRYPHTYITTTHDSKISPRFALQLAVFEMQTILGQVHRLTLKWHWTLKRQGGALYILQLPPPPRPKFHPFSLRSQPSLSYRSLWDNCNESPPKRLWVLKSQRYPIYTLQPLRGSNFTPFRSTASLFRFTGHFKHPHQMTPKWPWTVKGQRYPIYMLQLPASPKVQSVSPCSLLFLRYRPFWDKCTKWTQYDLELWKVKGTPYTR